MKRFAFFFFISLLILGGCKTKVTRTDVDTTIDISGHWNDTDSRLVAKGLIQDVLSRAWISDYYRMNNGKPTVIVGTVRNKSSEHIETLTFVKDIEKALINSGRVKVVASRTEREEIREERSDQQYYAREETIKKMAAETGADYMLKGVISTIVDAEGGKKVVFYQVDMELIDLENTEKVWLGSKKIKKYIKRPGAKW